MWLLYNIVFLILFLLINILKCILHINHSFPALLSSHS